MTQQTTTRPQSQTQGPKAAQTTGISLQGPRLPYIPQVEERYGLDKSKWKVLVEAIYPNAKSVESVILAAAYCQARGLDIFKRPVHIVPIWNKDLKRLVDTIWPGIGELRTTAHRTGAYAGHDQAVFGPTVTMRVGSVQMTFPEWCQMTVYRLVQGNRVAFPGATVYWIETYATKRNDDESPNDMWQGRPFGQIEKCAEAAALRAAFPEEIGNDYIPEEVEGRSGAGSILGAEFKAVASAPPSKVRRSTIGEQQKPTQTQQQEAPYTGTDGQTDDSQTHESAGDATDGAGPEDGGQEATQTVASTGEEGRQPGEDDEGSPLSDAALEFEERLNEPRLTRAENAGIMQDIIGAGAALSDWDRGHLNALIQRNTDRFKAKK